MALLAVGFEFDMTLDKGPRRNELFKNILRTCRERRKEHADGAQRQ